MLPKFVHEPKDLSDEDLLHRVVVVKDRLNGYDFMREKGMSVSGTSEAMDLDVFNAALTEVVTRVLHDRQQAHPVLVDVVMALITLPEGQRQDIRAAYRAMKDITEAPTENKSAPRRNPVVFKLS